MMNWKDNRPEGWENPYEKPIRDGVTWNKEVVEAFEAGADAMLEAIWKMARESPTKTFTFSTLPLSVFISDEEKVDAKLS